MSAALAFGFNLSQKHYWQRKGSRNEKRMAQRT
jgi:hypothetical protein